ncbi:MAG: formylglycine-generating enzyme family protein, partial [Polyangiaceae bacterium]
GMDLGEGGVVDVGSLPNCVGGYSGLHDMAGNVWEWENSCADDSTRTANCLIRGGSFSDGNASNMRCDNSGLVPAAQRNQTLLNVGIRCCSNPKL